MSLLISINLKENLIKNGLQPFPYKESNKKGYFNKAYFDNKEKTGETATNYNGLFDVDRYFITKAPDAHLGIALKNKNLRDLNNGLVILDFDLKEGDDMSVFKDIVDELGKKGYLNQYEVKNNKKGLHAFVRMSQDDLSKMEFQGKIHRGVNSFVEILTAGKFVRLCPNKDYSVKGNDSNGEHIQFEKVKNITLDELKAFSNDERDRVDFTSKAKARRLLVNEKINFDFKEGDVHFADETQRLIYKYATGCKMSYEDATRLASGLGFARQRKLFQSIDGFKNGKFNELFAGGWAGESKITPYLRDLINALRMNKDKFIIKQKYIDVNDMRKIFQCPEKSILVNAPTGTGKTHSSLTLAKEDNLKVIFAMPNKATVEQQGTKDGIKGVYDNKNMMDALENGNITVCTWNKLANIDEDFDLSEHYLVLDEAHTEVTTSDFRTEVIFDTSQIESRFKKVIRITATTDPLYLGDYNRCFTFIKPDTKKYKATVFEVQDKANANLKLINLLSEKGTNILCLNNDITFNDEYAKTREDAISWNSKTKNDKDYKSLVKNSYVSDKYKVVLATDIFSAGLNIENTGKWKVVINNVCDTALIKQLVARFRKISNITVEIIRVVKEDATRIAFDKDDKIEKMRFVLEENCKTMNDGIIASVNTNIRQDGFYTYKDNEFKVFKPAISLNCWRTHCKNLDSSQLFELFDDGTVDLEVVYCDHVDEVVDEFLDDVQAIKEFKKEQKEIRRERTAVLIAEHQENVYFYIDDEDRQYDNAMLKRYVNYRVKYELEHVASMDFTVDPDTENFTLYKILARNVSNQWKQNEKYKIAKFLYTKINSGDEYNLKELAKDKGFNYGELRKAVKAIWKTETVRRKNGNIEIFLERDCITKYDKKIEKNICECGAFFR